jgi:hypothetical protein
VVIKYLSPTLLMGAGRRDNAVVMDSHDFQSIGAHLDRQQPGKRGQRHDLPPIAVDLELARIRGICVLQRPTIKNVAIRAVPADRVDLAVENRLLQRLGHAHHQQQVAVGEPRHARVERAEDVSFGPDLSRHR